MKVELYFFKGCPTYQETARNLRDALKELHLQDNFDRIEVLNPEDAITKKFMGSPTIKINGTDLENKDEAYLFGCRVYTIDGKITGTPTKKYISEKLKSFIKA